MHYHGEISMFHHCVQCNNPTGFLLKLRCTHPGPLLRNKRWVPFVRNSKMRPISSLNRHQCVFCINVSHPFWNHSNNDTHSILLPTFSVAHFNLLYAFCIVSIGFFFFWLAIKDTIQTSQNWAFRCWQIQIGFNFSARDNFMAYQTNNMIFISDGKCPLTSTFMVLP